MLSVDEAIRNTGIFRATDRERLVLDTPVIDQGGICGQGGVLEATDGIQGPGEENGKSILEINGALVLGGTARTQGDHSEIHLIGGAELRDVCVQGVVVPDGQVGSFSGTITNAGTLKVAPNGLRDTLLVPGPLGGVLAGNGGGDDRVRLGGQFAARLGDFKSSFTNASDHIIDGAGIVFGEVRNDGTIDANKDNGEHLIVFPPGTKINNHVLRASGSGVLRIEDTVFQTADGVIAATGHGVVELNSDVTGTGEFFVYGCGVTARGGCTPPPKLRVADGVSVIGATLTISDEGVVEVAGSATLGLDGPVTISSGGIYQGSTSSAGSLTASLFADSLSICSGQMLLSDSMSLNVRGNVVLGIADTSLFDSPTVWLGGCTPPPLRLSVLGSASVAVGGALKLTDGEVEVEVGPDTAFALAGDFDNRSTTPESFDWMSGALIMKGTAAPTTQSFEVAGEDCGDSLSGFSDNFAMGTVEIASDSSVVFTDKFDNDKMGQRSCTEALYVDALILRAPCTITLKDCRVYYKNLIDEGAEVVREGCGDLVRVFSGDFDDDGRVDLQDYVFFEICLKISGPGHRPAFQECLDTFDVDLDGDIDLADVARFQTVFTGP